MAETPARKAARERQERRQAEAAQRLRTGKPAAKVTPTYRPGKKNGR